MSAFVRRATDQDLSAVMTIERACFSLPWTREAFLQELTQNACARYLIIEDAGEVLGYAGMWLLMEEAHVTNVAVRADARRKGYAGALMRALIQLAADTGLSYMTLECRRSNDAARALYHKLGFLDVGYKKRYYEDNGEDALFLCLPSLPPGNPEDDPYMIRGSTN